MGGETAWLAGPEHGRVLAELQYAFNTEFEWEGPSAEDMAPRLARMLAGAQCYAVVVGPAGAPAGFGIITLRPTMYSDGPLAVLDELYVKPPLRGAGLGGLLLAAAMTELARRGGEEMHINVDEEDVAARRFYLRHGFRNTAPDSDLRMLLYVREFPKDDGPRPG